MFCFEERSVASNVERFLSVLMHEFLFRSWTPSINVVGNVQNYTFSSKHGSRWRKKAVSRCCTLRDLMVHPYVASLVDYIDALYIDHDLDCLNMSQVRYAKRNLAFAIKRYKQLL